MVSAHLCSLPVPREGSCQAREHRSQTDGFVLVACGLGNRVALHPPTPCPTPRPCRAPAVPSPELIGRGSLIPAQRRKPGSPDVLGATPIAFSLCYFNLQTEELPERRRARPKPGRSEELGGCGTALAQPWGRSAWTSCPPSSSSMTPRGWCW